MPCEVALLSSLATLTVEISATSLRSVYLADSDEIARVNLMQIVGGLWGAMPKRTARQSRFALQFALGCKISLSSSCNPFFKECSKNALWRV